MLTVDKLSPQLDYLNQKPSAETHNVEKATAAYSAKNANKGKLTL